MSKRIYQQGLCSTLVFWQNTLDLSIILICIKVKIFFFSLFPGKSQKSEEILFSIRAIKGVRPKTQKSLRIFGKLLFDCFGGRDSKISSPNFELNKLTSSQTLPPVTLVTSIRSLE